MAEDVRRRVVPLELGVAALVGASTFPLSRLIRGGGVGALVVSTMVISLGVGWALRRLRVPATLSFGLSLLLLIWFAAIRFAAGTLWGIFPSLESLRALSDVIREGSATIVDEVAPVALSAGVELFILAGVWLTAAAIDVAIVRGGSPLIGITLAIPMFVIPGSMLESQRRVMEMLLFLGAGALVLFFDERVRSVGWGAIMGPSVPGWRWGPGIRLGALGIAAAIVVMPLLPGYGAPPGLNGLGRGDRVTFNPLVAIKPTLDRTPHRVLFTVQSPRSAYYRLTSLNEFTGDFWQDRSGGKEQPFGSEGIIHDASAELRQEIRIDALAGSWLPAAYQPVALHGIEDAVIQEGSRALLLNGPLERGMRYTVVSTPPEVSRALLDGDIAYDTDALASSLELPAATREEILPIAQRIVRGAATPFERARALQNHLRRFTYDENVAAGHSYSSIIEFLTESRRGYCEQFAGSMAVLARALGIPARVAIGFAGGDSAGNGTTIVTTEYAHAWVEVFFPQAGWVAFEPTPRAGIARVPAYALPDLDDPGQDTNSPEQQPTDEPAPDATDRPIRDPEIDPGVTIGEASGGLPAWAIALIVLGGLMTVAGAVVAGQLWWVRTRITHAPSPRAAVAERYVDFLAWCAATGYGRAPGETPNEHARRLGAKIPEAGEQLAKLATLVGEALWAPPNGVDPIEIETAVSDAHQTLAATLGRRRRALAAAGWGRWRAR